MRSKRKRSKKQNPNPILAKTSENPFVLERDSRKAIADRDRVFNRDDFDPFSIRADLNRLPSDELMAFMKCLLILQYLPGNALEEAAEELDKVADFYVDRYPQAKLPTISSKPIKGKLKTTKVRPPIILE